MNFGVNFLRGSSMVFEAFGLLAKDRRLRIFALWSAALTCFVLIVLLWLAWSLGRSAAAQIVSDPSALFRVLAAGVQFATFLIAFALGALTLPNVLLAPLQDPISAATEQASHQQLDDFGAAPSRLRGLVVAISHTLIRVAVTLAGFVIAFPLALVPTAGPVLWGTFAWMWSSVCLAAEHLSTPLGRRGYPFGQVVAHLRANKAMSLGFGSAIHVLLWFPVLNCLLLPVATVGGTLLALQLVKPQTPAS